MIEADLQFLHFAHPEHVDLVVSGSPFATAVGISGVDWHLADVHVGFGAISGKHILEERARAKDAGVVECKGEAARTEGKEHVNAEIQKMISRWIE